MPTTAADDSSQTTYGLTPMSAVPGAQMLCVAFAALVLVPYWTASTVATASLVAVVVFSLLGRGMLRRLSILCGLGVGHGLALAFAAKAGGLLPSIPTPVMGGILVVLFGAIAFVGLNLLVRAGEDLLEPRNLAIVALVRVSGVGGLSVGTADWALKGIGRAGVLGVVANLLLPRREKSR